MDKSLKPDTHLPIPCRDCLARQDGACAVLDPAELWYLASQSRRTRHQAGEALAVESDEIRGYANITLGTVKLGRLLRDGRQQLVSLQFAPDLLGRLFSSESPLSAEAATEVELCRVPKHVLESLVAGSDRLKRRLLDQTLRELDEARDWMVTLGRKSALERVASLLVLVARHVDSCDDEGNLFLDLPIGRADMADFLGLTIETVSRQMSRLRQEGVIAMRGHRCVIIRDLPALQALCG